MTEALLVEHQQVPPATPARPAPRLPIAVVVAAAIVLVVNAVVMLAGTSATGVSWDEPTHVSRMQNYLDHGWYLPSVQMDGAAPLTGLADQFVYAPVAGIWAHLVSVALGTEEPGGSVPTAAAYASRHVAVAILGLLGLAAAGALVRLLVGSWRWALLGAAALSALPLWTGHSMFNIKDVPVATGYTLLTLGAAALVRQSPPRRVRALAAGGLAAGVVLSVGTRPGMGVAAGASILAALAAGCWVDVRPGSWADARRGLLSRAAWALLGTAAAYAVLLGLYPVLFAHPEHLWAAAVGSSAYPWEGTILTAGSEVAMPPPPSYLPLWFAAQTPVVLGSLAVVGLLAPIPLLLRRGAGREDLVLGAGLALVGLQALLLPVAAVLRSAVLYDATRQVLFVQPALAVAAVVAAWLIARAASGRVPVTLRAAGAAALILGLVVPTATHIRLFPYSYTWFNPVAATRPIDGTWMTEYWRTSARALLPYIPEGGRESCNAWIPGGVLEPCVKKAQFLPYASTRGSAVPPLELRPDEYLLTEVNRHGSDLPDGCTALHVLDRPLFGQDVPMGWVARCRIDVPEYPAGGVRPSEEAAGAHLIRGWYPDGSGRTSGLTGDIALRAPASWAGRDLVVTVRAAPFGPPGSRSSLTVEVNGAASARFPAPALEAGTYSLVVPAAAAAAYGDGTVIVRITVPATSTEAQSGTGPGERPVGLTLDEVLIAPAAG